MNHMGRKPRFSILIPNFNRPDLVRLTIDSVLAQTFSDYELIVVDDGSTDQTIEVLRSYGSSITLLLQPNSGAEVARSKAAMIAAGQYLVLLDNDDILYPTALATYDRIIDALCEPPVILGAMSYFTHGDEPPCNMLEDERVEFVQFHDYLSKDRGVGLSCSNLVVKSSVAVATGALRKKLDAWPFETADIMLLLGTSGPCVLLRRPWTVAYRNHETNTVRRLDLLIKNVSCLVRYERLGQYPGGVYRQFDRYAYIGGVSWCYIAKGFRHGLFRISFRALAQTFPMVVIGAINTLFRRFRVRAPVITLMGDSVDNKAEREGSVANCTKR